MSAIIPKEPQVLWDTIERISEANPEFFCEFVVEVLKRGEESNRKATINICFSVVLNWNIKL